MMRSLRKCLESENTLESVMLFLKKLSIFYLYIQSVLGQQHFGSCPMVKSEQGSFLSAATLVLKVRDSLSHPEMPIHGICLNVTILRQHA